MYTGTLPRRRHFALTVTAAACLCGLHVSAQVYSANAVGYVNVTFYPGINMFANPLNLPTNNVGAVLNGLPVESVLYVLQNDGALYPNHYYGSDQWQDPTLILNPSRGARLDLPPGSPVTVTFVGEIAQGQLSASVAAGVSFCSSWVPQAGRLQMDLQFPPTEGDVVYLHNGSTQVYSRYDFSTAGGWVPSEPILAVAQGFILSNHLAVTTWSRSFSVSGGSYPVDIGLRLFDGAETLAISCEAPGPGGTLASPLRIAKNGTAYGIRLVDPGTPAATAIRVNTASGPKALAKWESNGDFISIRRNADGTVTLEWTGGGTLQTAPSVLGPWSDVAGAAPPYTAWPTGAMLFARTRR